MSHPLGRHLAVLALLATLAFTQGCFWCSSHNDGRGYHCDYAYETPEHRCRVNRHNAWD